MSWNKVGEWLKANAGPGTALVGSLLTGNIAGAVAAGVAMVSSATGMGEPDAALAVLQNNPETMLKLKELAYANESSIRLHIQAMAELEFKDKQAEHEQTQTTIRTGDNAEVEYVRHTRPKIARQSWYGTLGYIIGMEMLGTFSYGSGSNLEMGMILLSPAAAYMGFRTWDKFNDGKRKG